MLNYNKIFHYDDSTGDLIWLRNDEKPKTWNTRYSGKIAGYINSQGYISINVNNKMKLAHRIIWEMKNGDTPNVIDHINGVKNDNRIQNLRNVSYKENNNNRHSINKNNKSGYNNIFFDSRSRRWVKVIGYEKGLRKTKIYKTIEDAKNT